MCVCFVTTLCFSVKLELHVSSLLIVIVFLLTCRMSPSIGDMEAETPHNVTVLENIVEPLS